MLIDFPTLAQQCAPSVHPVTMHALVKTESGFNPFAIGVVGGHLVRQPKNAAEAVATARMLESQRINYSMGLGQINRANLALTGLTTESAFDPCSSLRASAQILSDCYVRAAARFPDHGAAMQGALSCYYSGSLKVSGPGNSAYVQKVAANTPTTAPVNPAPVSVPAIPVVMTASKTPAKPAANAPAPAAETKPAAARERAAWDVFNDFSREK